MTISSYQLKMTSDLKIARSGRRKIAPIDRFRAQVWYWVLKRQSKLSDYRLDMLFGQADGPKESCGQSRTRVFGAIKNKGVIPSRGGHAKRRFDLIKRVANVYPQTMEYYDSLIWELFDLEPNNLDSTNKFLIKCYERFKVSLLKGRAAGVWGKYAHHMQESGFEDYLFNRRQMSSYKMSLINVLDTIPKNLDSIALIGALYRKYHLEFNLPKALEIKEIFNERLNVVLDSPEMEPCSASFRALAIMIILCGRKGVFPTRKDRSRYGDEESAQLHSSRGVLVCSKNPTYSFYKKNKKEITVQMEEKWNISSV